MTNYVPDDGLAQPGLGRKQMMRKNLETFVSEGQTRASEVNDRTQNWHEIKSSDDFCELMTEVFVEYVRETNPDVFNFGKALTYFMDSLDGFETFQNPSLQDLRKRIARYLCAVRRNAGVGDRELFQQEDFMKCVFYVLTIQRYSGIESSPQELFRRLEELAG